MKNKNTRFTLAILSLFCHDIKAQSNNEEIKKYVIFTFEITHNVKKQKDIYYWITPQDSIANKTAFEVFPLYLEEYSNDNLEMCKLGKTIDIFGASTATNFDFEAGYKQGVMNLLSLINSHKIKIQTFKKKWTRNGDEINVNVYACPIIGQFCDCILTHGKPTYGFKGLVYLPVMAFDFDNNFWNGKYEKTVKYVDYSYVEYSSCYPSYMHGNSDIRVKSKIQAF
jgi:hypothetical protein